MSDPSIVGSNKVRDAGVQLHYDDGSKATVHYVIPVDESGLVISPTGGGGGGGPVTEADGANVALGSKVDAPASDATSSWTLLSVCKGILSKLLGSIAVTGTFWQTTQPVSGSVTANAGTSLNTSALALETGGNLATVAGAVSGGKVKTTAADGDLVTLGTKTDATATDTTSAWTAQSLLRGILAQLRGTLTASISGAVAVTGTFWQATQPVSGTFWQAIQPVSGTFWQTTQPVSAASLPLPSGAAQDGTDITGPSMPAGGAGIRGWLSAIYNTLKNGSVAVTGTFWQATQPVSGTVTANAGTNLNTSALALETGGNLAASKADLDTLAGTVSVGKAQVKLFDSSGNPLLISSNPGFVNLGQVGGTAVDTGSGVKSAGTQRTVLATDQPQLTIPRLVAGSALTSLRQNPGLGQSGADILAGAQVQQNSTGTWDPVPNLNWTATFIASGSHTGTIQSAVFTNYGWAGLAINFQIGTSGNPNTLSFTISIVASVGGILANTTAITPINGAATNYGFILAPGATLGTGGTPNTIVQSLASPLPGGSFFILINPSDNTHAMTYSVTFVPIQ